MFGLRLAMDLHPRTKNGHPPHSTTGVAKAISNHCLARGETPLVSAAKGAANSAIATTSTGIARIADTQNRRVIFSSSGFVSSSALTSIGSSAIPQIGHDPGSFRTISGCIGQVYSRGPLRDLTGVSVGRTIAPAYRLGSAANFFKHPAPQK